MRGERAFTVVLTALLVLSGVFVFQVSLVMADPVPKTIFGYVDPNSTDGAVAFPGTVVFYIQNRTSEQKDIDVMYYQPPPPDPYWYYASAIEDAITDWNADDPGIVVVSVEHGTYPGGDRIGYVAYSNATLDGTGSQLFPSVELQKISVPQFVSSNETQINMSWSALPDTWGLIAGYVVYRSETNASDADWTLVGGSINAPLTDLYFNDTTVSAGTIYYYSIKVIFNGIFDEPWNMNVDNHECDYYGEGSAPMSTPVLGEIDYIKIMDAPGGGGNVIDTMTYIVFETDDFYACGFNDSTGYVSDVDVDLWESDATSIGDVFPTTGIQTVFTAQWVPMDSTCTVTATYGTISNSTGLLTVLAPRVDFIVIRDEPDGAGNAVDTATYGVWEIDTFYAAGYNNTAGYLGDVAVDWSIDDPSAGDVSPTTGSNTTTFTALLVAVDTQCTVTATYSPTISDSTGLLTVLYPRTDYVQIRTADYGEGIDLCDPSNYPYYLKSTVVTYYGASYNSSVGYIGSVPLTSTWGSNNTAIVDLSSTVGNMTDIQCDPVNTGWVWITLDDGTHSNQTRVTVISDAVDYIQIRNASGGLGIDLGLLTNYPDYPVGHITTFYAAAYNDSVGYLFDIGSTWTTTDNTIVDVTPSGSSTTITCSDTLSGTVTITATDNTWGKTNFTLVTVIPPTVDFIQIRDTAGGLGNVVTTMTYWVYDTDDFFAASYNNTADYLGDVSVDWWSDATTVGDVSPATGTMTTFTADWVPTDSTCTVWADYGGITNSTGLLTVLTPRVVEIMIRDTAGGLGNVVGAMTYWVYDTDDFYAAGYNATVGYLNDVAVDWWSDTPTVGDVSPTTGSDTTTFTAQQVASDGTCTVWAAYNGFTNSTGLLTVLAPRVVEIMIRDTAGGLGNVVGAMTYWVYDTDDFYAAGYNATVGYLNDVAVDWWSDTPTVGDVSPTTGSDTTTFTAQQVASDGTCTVWAAYNGFTNSTGLLTVLAPRVVEIMIRDTAGGLGNVVGAMTYWVYDTDDFYAAGYNETVSYLGDVPVDWWSDAPTVGDVTPTTGSDTTAFTAQQVPTDNTCTVWAAYNGITNSTGLLTVLAPRVIEIKIRDTAGGAGNVVTTATYNADDTDTFHAAGYNETVGYLNDVDATWNSDDAGVGQVTPSGTSTTFTAQTVSIDSTCTITATYNGVSNSTGLLTVLGAAPPTVDYIVIMDAAGGTGNPIWEYANWPGASYSYYAVGQTDTFWAAGFNSTTGEYVEDVEVTWSALDIYLNPDTTNGTVVAGPAISTTFTANSDHGGALFVRAENTNLGLLNSTDMLIIIPPTPDYIEIRDAPDEGGSVVTTATYIVNQMDEFYAAAYNNTAGYIGEVVATWTCTPSTVGTVDTTGHWTNFTAQEVSTDTTCTVTATYDSLTDSTGLLTVLAPKVDEIMIRDEAGGTGDVVETRTYNALNTDTFYAAAYNDTVGYLYDVSATWACDPSAVGQVTSPGTSTTFEAQTMATTSTCTVTATYDSVSNSTGLLTVNAVPDTIPPARPSQPTIDVKDNDVTVTWDPNTESDLDKYIIQRAESSDGPWVNITEVDKSQTSYTDKDLKAGEKYYYRIIAVDEAGNPSQESPWAIAEIEPAEEFPWILLLLLIIIIIVILLLLLFMMRKKKPEEEALPPEEAPPAAAPSEEAPPEAAEEEYVEYEEYEEAEPSEEYEEYEEEEPGEEYEEYEEYEEEPETEETPKTPPPPPPP